MKRMLACFLTLSLCICLLGCASASGEETITVALWGDDARKAAFQELFAPLEAEKNIKVDVQVYPASEYATKILTQIAGGSAPDVVWLTERYYPLFASQGVLADLNPLMSDAAYKFEDYSASLVGNYLVGGNLMAVPFTANPVALFYNASLFQEAGLETPLKLYQKGEWTFDRMLECAKAITALGNGTYGVSFLQTGDPTNWPVLLNYFWTQGVDFFNADTTRCTVNTPEGVAALQKYYDMMFVDNVHVKPSDTVAFESGKLGMYQDNPSASANYQDVGFDWDYICFPANGEGELNNVVGVALYGVINTTKNYEAALDVVKYITGEELQTALQKTFTPTRESLKASEAFLGVSEKMPTPKARGILYGDVFAATTKTYPATTNWAEINLKVKEILDKLYTGNYSVADVAAELEREVNALLGLQ